MKFLLRSAILLVLFGAFAASAGAQQIISARWGRRDRWADVRYAVERQLARGHRSFEASNDVLGIDPAKGDEKYLEVVYSDGTGRTFEQRVKEGDTFRFRFDDRFAGGPPSPPIVEERGPRVGLRFEGEGVAPTVPGGGVRIVNQFPHTIRIFTTGRTGESRLVATLAPGDRITPEVRLRPDRRWIVTTTDGVELRRFTTGLRGETIILR